MFPIIDVPVIYLFMVPIVSSILGVIMSLAPYAFKMNWAIFAMVAPIVIYILFIPTAILYISIGMYLLGLLLGSIVFKFSL
jgi:hypothetical protein